MLTISELARGLGFSRQYVQRSVKEGCPLDDFESARLWFSAHRTHPKKLPKSPVEEKASPGYRPNGKNGDGDLDDALRNSVHACSEAWRLLEEAFIEGKPSKISVWLNLHTKAIEARVKAESTIRVELERQKILIPMTEAKTSVRRVVEIVVTRLSAMPQNIAPRCNPHAPEHAMEILHEECTAIIADAQEVYTSWSDDRAPASNSPQL
jgi:hypothetical protein